MTDARSLSEDDLALAAEYVLGVQDAADRAATEARIRRDAVFARAVSQWEADLSGLDDGFADAPAPDLLPAIEDRLFGKAVTPAPRWTRWLWGAGLAGALGALALVYIGNPQAPAPLVATLTAEGQTLVYAARYDADADELTVTRTGGEGAGATQAHEVWLIAGGNAPVSLGLIQTAELRRTLPDLPAGAVLAISLEPAGGSPTGAPTGPVLVTGEVTGV